MTLEQLNELLASTPEAVIDALKKSSYTVPKWEDLQPQYDPLQHSINDTTLYPAKENDNNVDDFERTSLSLQKLAVSRVSQAMFATPVQRVWSYDRDSDGQGKAVDIIEELYRVQNNIDSENIERGKKNNASCEIVTVWSALEKETTILSEPSKFQLTHRTYSPMDGYEIYAQQDDYGQIIVISIGYKDADNTEFFDIYINGEPPKFIRFSKEEDWVKSEDSKDLEVFPIIHTWLPEPVWGGLAGTILVEQLEKMESYQGLYITRNALPTFTHDMGDTSGMEMSDTEESASDSRRIIRIGKGGRMQDVTWKGAEEAVSARYARIRNAYFEQVQMPDISFANLINSNTSAENKELLFSDSKAKAIDLGGEWTKFFQIELDIVKAFAKIMFPSFTNEFDRISARSIIIPYSIKSKKENSEFVAAGGESMSLETRIRELDTVDDVDQEADIIREEQSAQINQGIL